MAETERTIKAFVDELTRDDHNSYYYLSGKIGEVMASRAYRKGDLCSAIAKINADHIYISCNGFTSPEAGRKSQNVRQIHGIFCDLDCHTGSSEERASAIAQGLVAIKSAIHSGILLEPTMIVHTGRGVQLYFLYAKSIPTKKTDGSTFNVGLQKHAYFQKIIYNTLETILDGTSLEVDPLCKDVTRLVRVAGTVNAKTGTEAYIIELSGKRYTFADLQDLPILELSKGGQKM